MRARRIAWEPRIREDSELFYTVVWMKRTLLGMGVLVLLTQLPRLQAVEKPYQIGEIVSVEKKVHTQVLYYIVDTPITKDNPYYEVSIRFGDEVCVGEYTPRHAADTPPQAWTPSSEVQVRVEKHHMFVKASGVPDWDLPIVKRLQAPEGKSQPAPLAPKK